MGGWGARTLIICVFVDISKDFNSEIHKSVVFLSMISLFFQNTSVCCEESKNLNCIKYYLDNNFCSHSVRDHILIIANLFIFILENCYILEDLDLLGPFFIQFLAHASISSSVAVFHISTHLIVSVQKKIIIDLISMV